MIDQVRDRWDGRAVTGADARVAFTIDKAPGGKIVFGVVVADGSVAVHDEAPADAELTILMPAPLVTDWAAGRLDLAVAYMRGDAKITGDPGPVIDLVKTLSAPSEDRAAPES